MQWLCAYAVSSWTRVIRVRRTTLLQQRNEVFDQSVKTLSIILKDPALEEQREEIWSCPDNQIHLSTRTETGALSLRQHISRCLLPGWGLPAIP